jgi:hypothetical protein
METIEVNCTVARDEIDAEDWAAGGDAFGIIVRRDHRRDKTTARAFPDEENIPAEWEATKTELVTTVAVEGPEMGDSTERVPSSGPMAPRGDTKAIAILQVQQARPIISRLASVLWQDAERSPRNVQCRKE